MADLTDKHWSAYERFNEIIVESNYSTITLIDLYGFSGLLNYINHTMYEFERLGADKVSAYFEEVYRECNYILEELERDYPKDEYPERWI